MQLPDMNCPGDTLFYNCSIESNTEYLHLIWNVSFPDYDVLPEVITYNDTSTLLSRDDQGYNISTTLTRYGEGHIEATIEITLTDNFTMNGTLILVECSITDLESDSLTYIVNTSGEA